MSADGTEYAAVHINKTRWGAVSRKDDGSWVTRWRIGTRADVRGLAENETVEVAQDAEVGFRASVSAVGARELELRIDTEHEAMAAPYYVLTYQAFGVIDAEIAAIETIESLPKEWYAPFRDRA